MSQESCSNEKHAGTLKTGAPVSPRTASRLAWALWVIVVALVLVTGIWGLAAGGEFDASFVAFVIFVVVFSTVGALISSRLPSNPIGWIMIGAATSYVIGGLSLVFEDQVAHTGPIPLAGRLVIWVGSWAWSVGLGLAGIFLLLLFPSGRAPSSRWRVVGYTGAVGVVLLISSIAFDPNWQAQGLHGTNPVGIRGAESVLRLAGDLGGALLIGSVGAAAISLFLRFRRSKGKERQQLKWLAYAAAVVASSVAAIVPLEAVLGSGEELDDLSNLLITASFALVPIATGIAILRYRLYAIDRIINKTLVFGLLSAILLAGYAGGILLLQSVLPVPNDSAITVAASTLAMAALFGPLRVRIQEVVDRRFYRARYNATQAVESFGSRLRHETDLDSLTADLIGVVTSTVQPTKVSLWLRRAEAAK
jgi:hypothetical protein